MYLNDVAQLETIDTLLYANGSLRRTELILSKNDFLIALMKKNHTNILPNGEL